MKKICLFLVFLSATIPTVFSQTDLSEINKPLEYVEQANKDIENGDYEQAVQKLIAAIRLQPKLRDAYLSLNVACSYTNQNAILKSYLQKAKTIFEEDDDKWVQKAIGCEKYDIGNMNEILEKRLIKIRPLICDSADSTIYKKK